MTIFSGKYHRETYSQHELESIFERYSVTPSHRAALVKGLEDCAAIWRWCQSPHENSTTPSAAVEALKVIAKRAEALNTAIGTLPQDVQDVLRHRLEDAQAIALINGAAPIVSLQDFSRTDPAPLISLDDLINLLSCVRDTSLEAVKEQPPGKGGAKPDYALRRWITNMALVWEEIFGRDTFTRDVDRKGAPVTKAARFCVEAFAHVSPETPPSRVLNAMRLHIARQRRKATCKVRPQTEA